MKSSFFDITELEKDALCVLNVISKKEPKQITSPLSEILLSKINKKYPDQRICRYFFKKYFNIDIGKYTYGTPQLLNSNLTLLKSIGSFCSIGLGLTILNGNHPLNRLTTHPSTFDKRWGFVKNNSVLIDLHQKNKEILIGNDVWIGVNVIILPSVIISDGAVIGTGSVVTKNVEPYSIVGGVPARHIKDRFNKDVIDSILKSRWWDMKDDDIRKLYDDLSYSDTKYIDNSYNDAIKRIILSKYIFD